MKKRSRSSTTRTRSSVSARWSFGLIRASNEALLDKQADGLLDEVKEALAKEPETTLTDLHVWCIGPNIYSAIVTILTPSPKSPCHYREVLASVYELVHITVEVNQPQQRLGQETPDR